MTTLRGSFVPPVTTGAPGQRAVETVLHVRPSGVHWQVIRDGKSAFTVETKTAAVIEAGRQAREARPSRIVVHAFDDDVEAEAVYPAALPSEDRQDGHTRSRIRALPARPSRTASRHDRVEDG